jgi:predicted TIM-barrel fold metal-dependent hydrolase
MIIDFHTHIFPGRIRENRNRYFPSEPAFTLLYSRPGSKLAGAARIVESMDEHGVDKSVVFGFPWKNNKLSMEHNDYIMEATARYPGRLIGLGCFDPGEKDAPAEALRCLQGGLSGIGELAFYESGIGSDMLDRLGPVMTMCKERSVPVLIHTNEPVGHSYPGKSPITLSQIYRLVQRFPENRIVLAHWGGGLFFFNLLKQEVCECLANVYFDTAASPFLYHPDVYRHAGQIVGTEKILFGSDFPLLSPRRYFKEMETSGLSKDEIERICGRNAEKLLEAATDPPVPNSSSLS